MPSPITPEEHAAVYRMLEQRPGFNHDPKGLGLPWPPADGLTQIQMKAMGYHRDVWWIPRRPRKRHKGWKQSPEARKNNILVKMVSTPEGRALLEMRRIKGINSPRRGRPHGSTEGFKWRVRDRIIDTAKQEAKEIVAYMESKGYDIPQQEYAKEAIEVAVELMRRKDINPKDKLQSARTVLEWTKAKPASESTVNVRTAESFLEEVARDMEAAKKQQ